MNSILMLSCISGLSVIIGMGTLSGCLQKNAPRQEKVGADLVVYGKIITSADNRIEEAFAVKNGKHVYVGDVTIHSRLSVHLMLNTR